MHCLMLNSMQEVVLLPAFHSAFMLMGFWLSIAFPIELTNISFYIVNLV